MSPESLAAWAALAATILGFVWRAVKWRDRLRDEHRETQREQRENKRKLEIVWSYMMDRGLLKSELDDNGIEPPRPFRRGSLAENVRQRFETFRTEMQTVYRSEWKTLEDEAAMLEIQGKFGKRILEYVCRPLRWTDGECLQAALIIAKE